MRRAANGHSCGAAAFRLFAATDAANKPFKGIRTIKRIELLDGWRAISILLVLLGHLFPMGPASWAMNAPIAAAGMALFFTLSGFLITQFLLYRPDVPEFLRRRLFRILPLAWSAMVLLWVVDRAGVGTLAANILFVSNLPPQHLLTGGGHLWSLCVEMQFYVGVALLVLLLGRRGLYLLPALGVCVTCLRIGAGAHVNIVTWFRLDEILAGASLALIYSRRGATGRGIALPNWLPLVFLSLTVAAGHDATGPLNYLRPYLAAATVGSSLYSCPRFLHDLLTSQPARYVAEISYALYVFHGMFVETWLGSGEKVVKYAKRPLLLVATFGAAHASTFWFERPMIAWGKRIGRTHRAPATSP